MIAVDTNVMVYAHRQDVQWNPRASRCLTELDEGGAPWAMLWPCVHEFIGVVTHPRIFPVLTPFHGALDQIDAWFESPSVVLLNEAPAYWGVIKSVLSAGQIAGPKVHDAKIAAICLQHGVRELWTADRDFSRFPALRTRNPILS